MTYFFSNRVIGGKSWQHTLDAERATHARHIIIACTERLDEIDDMVGD